MIGNIFLDHNGNFQSISVTDVVSLVAAILSFSGIIYGVIANRKTQKDIAQQQIDANLKAKARIEWIEKVRENTSNLISVLLTLQKEDKDFSLIWESGEKYSEILKLYFSSKVDHEVSKDIYINNNIIELSVDAEKILFNTKSNENKNQYIKEYISCLMKIYRNDHYNNVRKQLVGIKKVEIKKTNELFEIASYEYQLEEIELDDGEVVEGYSKKAVKPENDDSRQYNKLEKDIARNKRLIIKWQGELEGFENIVTEFSSIISLYLKIEWDKAKEGR